ncbi:MAG: FAD-dependent oxidoreductase [Planctomycetota bacterium]
MITITIDGQKLQVDEDTSVLEAARRADIYIPALCSHPDLPAFRELEPIEAIYHGSQRIEGEKIDPGKLRDEEGCKLCLVRIEGVDGLVTSCTTPVKEGMVVTTDSPEIKKQRRANLMPILEKHPHACLTCAQKEGCSREPCSTNVPVNERCCPLLGRCELQKIAEYIGVKEETPRYIPAELPVVEDEPLFIRDYNLCIGCTRCVRACRNVRGIDALGFVYRNGRFEVGTVAPTLTESGCKFCTACVEVCPTGALSDRDVSVADREKDLLPCKGSCPADIDVPGYLRLIAQKRYGEAAALIREKVPFPAVLGRVCFHPCEQECRRGEVNEPIAICALKGYAADNDGAAWKGKTGKAPETGKSIAIVGSGPAGLTAAYYLAGKGHRPVVFEAAPEAGGMLRYGIPEYRLPPEVLKREIDAIVERGVEIRANTPLGNGRKIESLKTDGFDAVLLAVGMSRSRKLDIPGVDSGGVLWGLEFLKRVRTGDRPEVGEKVTVIGGGNVAVDVAMTARRLGAKDVQMVCLESHDEIPAHEWELKQARDEGIRVVHSLGPKKIDVANEKVKQTTFVKCTSVFNRARKFAPEFDESVKESFEADTVILAIGQQADLDFLGDDAKKIVEGGRIVAGSDDTGTSIDGVFAAGDVTGGPISVIDAIASGRRAAAAIDRYLGGDGNIEEKFVETGQPSPHLGREEGFAERKRVEIAEAPPEERCKNFDQI